MTEPTDKLYAEVLADAARQADAARNTARQEAERFRAAVEATTHAAAEAIRAEGQADAAARRGRILATVEIEIERQRLHIIEADLQQVHDQALARLRALDAAQLRQAQVYLAVDALAQMPPEAEVLLALPANQHAAQGPQLLAEIQQALGKSPGQEARATVKLRLADQPADIPDGVFLRSADGRLEIDNSFAARLRRLWPDLRLEVAAALFPDLTPHEET